MTNGRSKQRPYEEKGKKAKRDPSATLGMTAQIPTLRKTGEGWGTRKTKKPYNSKGPRGVR